MKLGHSSNMEFCVDEVSRAWKTILRCYPSPKLHQKSNFTQDEECSKGFSYLPQGTFENGGEREKPKLVEAPK